MQIAGPSLALSESDLFRTDKADLCLERRRGGGGGGGGDDQGF